MHNIPLTTSLFLRKPQFPPCLIGANPPGILCALIIRTITCFLTFIPSASTPAHTPFCITLYKIFPQKKSQSDFKENQASFKK